MTLADNVRIVLVEPAGPLNVGAIARVIKNMGLNQLILVNPQCDPRGEDARKMAVHGVDILESAIEVATLPQALQKCQRAIATTVRDRSFATELEHPRSALSWLLEAPSALIFGPEDRGLSNDELKYAQRFVRIPSSDAYPSLNLAQAVAICCYELYQIARSQEGGYLVGAVPPEAPPLPIPEAPLEVLEEYYQHLEAVLLNIGYLYPHTAQSRMKKFRRLFNRAHPTESEVAMLQGILSQIEWAASYQRRVDDTLKAACDFQQSQTPEDL